MAAKLVGFSTLDLKHFLPIMQQALDRNVAVSADRAGVDPPLHHMLCVAGIKDENVRPTAASLKPYAPLFHAAFLIGCDERDTAEVLEIASMPAIVTPTCQRGIDCLLLSGTMDKWVFAVMRGCSTNVNQEARKIYNSVYAEFARVRLDQLFDANRRAHADNTFLLEKK